MAARGARWKRRGTEFILSTDDQLQIGSALLPRPTYSSWINLVERWFAALTDKALRRATHRSVKRLNQAIKRYIDVNNENPKPLTWTKTADEILASIAKFCKRTSGAGHY
jgi:hypothetical protein